MELEKDLIQEKGEKTSKIKRLLSSRSFHSLLGVSVSVILLLWVFSGIDIAAVKEPLFSAHYWVLFPCLLILIVHFFIRAWRWYYLLPSGSQTSLMERLDSIMVGNFANFVLPLRAGEFVRPFLLSKLSKTSFAEGFASIVTERFFDLAAAIITFAIILHHFPIVPDWISTSAWILGAIAVFILVFIVYVIFAPKQSLAIFDYFFPVQEKVILRKARHFLVDFIASAHILADPKRLFMVLFLTFLVWVSTYVLYTAFLYLIDVEQTFLLGTTVSVVIALAVAAPSAPGFLGVYQTACLASFTLFQLGEEQAFVYSVITHLFQYVIFIGYGVYVLSKTGMKLTELRERTEQSLENIS